MPNIMATITAITAVTADACERRAPRAHAARDGGEIRGGFPPRLCVFARARTYVRRELIM